MIIGVFVKVIQAPTEAAKGAGPWGVIGGAVALGALLYAGYRSLESVLLGLQSSAHDSNIALAWGAGKVALVAAVVAGAWVLMGRRREVKDRPVVAEHEAAMIEARRVAIARHPAGRALPASACPRIPSQRVDRVEVRR